MERDRDIEVKKIEKLNLPNDKNATLKRAGHKEKFRFDQTLNIFLHLPGLQRPRLLGVGTRLKSGLKGV